MGKHFLFFKFISNFQNRKLILWKNGNNLKLKMVDYLKRKVFIDLGKSFAFTFFQLKIIFFMSQRNIIWFKEYFWWQNLIWFKENLLDLKKVYLIHNQFTWLKNNLLISKKFSKF